LKHATTCGWIARTAESPFVHGVRPEGTERMLAAERGRVRLKADTTSRILEI